MEQKTLTEQQKRYLVEAARQLARAGYEIVASDRNIFVELEGRRLCELTPSGGVQYRQEDIIPEQREQVKDQLFKICSNIHDYMRQLDAAPFLKADGLRDKYKLLSEFNGTVLAGMEGKYGIQFVTWQRDFSGNGLCWGHYHGSNFAGAKEDFVRRAGLIPGERLFSDEQLSLIYRCCQETLDAEQDFTYQQTRDIHDIKEQIEDALPQLSQEQEKQDMEPTLSM